MVFAGGLGVCSVSQGVVRDLGLSLVVIYRDYSNNTSLTAQCIKLYAAKRMHSAGRNHTRRLAKARLHNLRSKKKNPLIMLFANFMPNVLTTCRMEEKSLGNATEMKWILKNKTAMSEGQVFWGHNDMDGTVALPAL